MRKFVTIALFRPPNGYVGEGLHEVSPLVAKKAYMILAEGGRFTWEDLRTREVSLAFENEPGQFGFEESMDWNIGVFKEGNRVAVEAFINNTFDLAVKGGFLKPIEEK